MRVKVSPDGPLTDLKALLESGQVLLEHTSAALQSLLLQSSKINSSAQCTVVSVLSEYQRLRFPFFYTPLLSKGLLHQRPISLLADHVPLGESPPHSCTDPLIFPPFF